MSSMWKKIRKSYGITLEEMGKQFGKSRQLIWQYENGIRKMPKWLQIEYLKLRNTEDDKKIIKFLKEE